MSEYCPIQHQLADEIQRKKGFLSQKCNCAQKPLSLRQMPVDGLLRSTPAAFYPSKLFAKTQRRRKTEVLIETFIRKQLRLKAHTVTRVEETDESMVVHIDRLGRRLLRCGVCRQHCREVHSTRP